MSKSRRTIGRTFSAPVITEAEERQELIFTLSSGRRAVFIRTTVPAGAVATGTYVVQAHNGRDQSALTPESLRDITRTLSLQQFFPAIGVRTAERIEILDGSRRRAAALLCECALEVLVTDSTLSAAEARDLARDIQTAREHNLREVGLRLALLKESGLSQKEIAGSENLSQATVTRALQAASVDAALIAVFPVPAILSHADYRLLMTVQAQLEEKNISPARFTDGLSLLPDDAGERADEDVKVHILAALRTTVSAAAQVPARDKLITRSLWQFPDKNRFARKKSRDRMFAYEFSRLSPELQRDLDEAIQDVLEKHLPQ